MCVHLANSCQRNEKLKLQTNLKPSFLSGYALCKVSGSSAFLYWSLLALASHLETLFFVHGVPWPHLMLALERVLSLGNAQLLPRTFYSYQGLLKKMSPAFFFFFFLPGSWLQFPQKLSRFCIQSSPKFFLSHSSPNLFITIIFATLWIIQDL